MFSNCEYGNASITGSWKDSKRSISIGYILRGGCVVLFKEGNAHKPRVKMGLRVLGG